MDISKQFVNDLITDAQYGLKAGSIIPVHLSYKELQGIVGTNGGTGATKIMHAFFGTVTFDPYAAFVYAPLSRYFTSFRGVLNTALLHTSFFDVALDDRFSHPLQFHNILFDDIHLMDAGDVAAGDYSGLGSIRILNSQPPDTNPIMTFVGYQIQLHS